MLMGINSSYHHIFRCWMFQVIVILLDTTPGFSLTRKNSPDILLHNDPLQELCNLNPIIRPCILSFTYLQVPRLVSQVISFS